MSTAAEEQVRSLEIERCAALITTDLVTLDRITAPDYTHVETGGNARDKAGFLAAIGRPGQQVIDWVIEENTVRVYGDTAVVTGRYHSTVRTPAGVATKHARHIRVYVRRDGRWQNVAHQATALTPPPG